MNNLVKISAFDSLFFGTGRPFTMGDDSWASAIFPPNPNTLHGLLRGSYFTSNMDEFVNVDENNDPTKNLKIQSYGLEMEQKDGTTEPIFPLPLDYVKNVTKDRFIPLRLQAIEKAIISNYALKGKSKLIYTGDDKVRNTNGSFYITETEMNKYIKGSVLSDQSPFSLDDFLTQEPKIGISRNRYDTQEKALYRINLTRPENEKHQKINFWIAFEGMDIAEHLLKRLGGEGKLVSISKTEDLTMSIVSFNDFEEGSIVKIYLATPAIFDKGWHPEIKGATLIATSIGKIQRIGGWDVIKKRPKASLKAVAAGSVYYYTITNKGNFINSIQNNSIGQETDKGFGKILVAKHGQ